MRTMILQKSFKIKRVFLLKISLLTVFLFANILAISQPIKGKGNLGVSFFYMYNQQGSYDSQYGNVSYTSHLKLFGTQTGGTLDYKRMLNRDLFITLGLGFLDFEINRIENETKDGNLIIKTNARSINYPSTLDIFYQTTKYHYNNLCFHLGIERQFIFLNKLSLFTGIDYLHAYKISEIYYIPFAKTYYRTTNHGNFGDFVNARFGVSRQLGKFSLAPAFVLPIYNGWGQDIIFKEDPSRTVSNWFNGVGISMNISYQIFYWIGN